MTTEDGTGKKESRKTQPMGGIDTLISPVSAFNAASMRDALPPTVREPLPDRQPETLRETPRGTLISPSAPREAAGDAAPDSGSLPPTRKEQPKKNSVAVHRIIDVNGP